MKYTQKSLALLLALGCSFLYCGEKKEPAPEAANKASQDSPDGSMATPEENAKVAATTPEAATESINAEKILKPCTPCHYLDKGVEKKKSGLGPGLLNVYNRAPSIFPDKSPFAKWDDAALDTWLANPNDIKRGTSMTYKVTNAEKRALMIRAMKTLK